MQKEQLIIGSVYSTLVPDCSPAKSCQFTYSMEWFILLKDILTLTLIPSCREVCMKMMDGEDDKCRGKLIRLKVACNAQAI